MVSKIFLLFQSHSIVDLTWSWEMLSSCAERTIIHLQLCHYIYKLLYKVVRISLTYQLLQPLKESKYVEFWIKFDWCAQQHHKGQEYPSPVRTFSMKISLPGCTVLDLKLGDISSIPNQCWYIFQNEIFREWIFPKRDATKKMSFAQNNHSQ